MRAYLLTHTLTQLTVWKRWFIRTKIHWKDRFRWSRYWTKMSESASVHHVRDRYGLGYMYRKFWSLVSEFRIVLPKKGWTTFPCQTVCIFNTTISPSHSFNTKSILLECMMCTSFESSNSDFCKKRWCFARWSFDFKLHQNLKRNSSITQYERSRVDSMYIPLVCMSLFECMFERTINVDCGCKCLCVKWITSERENLQNLFEVIHKSIKMSIGLDEN